MTRRLIFVSRMEGRAAPTLYYFTLKDWRAYLDNLSEVVRDIEIDRHESTVDRRDLQQLWDDYARVLVPHVDYTEDDLEDRPDAMATDAVQAEIARMRRWKGVKV